MLALRRWLGFAVATALAAAAAGNSFAQAPAPAPSAADAERIRKIEKNVFTLTVSEKEPPIELSLTQVMQLFKVPGLSVAVIDNFQIVWAKGYGVLEPGSSSPVTTHTLFQAGSISKPVAAAGALALVEQGKLSLDENVNLKLKSWKVPDNEFTVTEKVTLRRLMSHTAGTDIHGFPGYAVGEPLPTVVQVLDGEKPANTGAVRVVRVPGTKSVYSGGGVTVEQLLMTDVTQKPFPVLLRELVLDKVGMKDSSYEQPLPPARASATAGGADSSGKPIPGRWHIYPEMAAAGLWTTPTDLSLFAIEIANARNGKSSKVLSQAMATQMLTPVLDDAGLGFFLMNDFPGGFGHNGADDGFQALLKMSYTSGKGMAAMADSDNGILVENLFARAVAREYAWDTKPGSEVFDNLYLLVLIKGTPTALKRYDEVKAAAPDHKVVEGMLNELGYRVLYAEAKPEDAIVIFQRNVQEYPESSNAYDSLAEAYAVAGKKDLAIQNYKKALELDPKNENSAERLKKLQAQP